MSLQHFRTWNQISCCRPRPITAQQQKQTLIQTQLSQRTRMLCLCAYELRLYCVSVCVSLCATSLQTLVCVSQRWLECVYNEMRVRRGQKRSGVSLHVECTFKGIPSRYLTCVRVLTSAERCRGKERWRSRGASLERRRERRDRSGVSIQSHNTRLKDWNVLSQRFLSSPDAK